MTMERKSKLLENMVEYLTNYSILFKKIGVSEGTDIDEAYHNCLGYIVELVGSDGDKHFYENILGFTKEELIGEGMEWVYE